MNEHPIEGLMDVTLEKIKSMVDSNTIIGNPINVRGNSVRMLQLADTSNSVDRAIGMMPEMVDKVADLFGKNKKNDTGAAE